MKNINPNPLATKAGDVHQDCQECRERRVAQSGRTHWDGCWRHHLECAVARVEQLELETEQLSALLDGYVDSYIETARQADARLAVAVEALRDLADTAKWRERLVLRGMFSQADMSEVAREALAKIEEVK